MGVTFTEGSSVGEVISNGEGAGFLGVKNYQTLN